MLRLPRKPVLRACTILALLAATAAVGGAVPYSDFEDGTLQGWTKLQPFNGNLENHPSGGNPGGFMYCGDTMAGGGGLQARAPSDFTGDLSFYRGLQWDQYLFDCNPDPTMPTVPWLYAVIGGDTTIFRERDPQVGSLEQWQGRFVRFDSASWELDSGTASFDSAIRHVSMLTISMDCNTMCYAEAGVDNVMILGPDPEQSSVDPWDAYGHVFVSPGVESGVDALSLTVRDFSGAPLADAPVEIRFFGCELLCFDHPETGLTGTTDANGSVTLDPRVGGCDDCTIQVTADGIVLRTYTKVVSTDWNGFQADGLLDPTDLSWLVAAIQQNYPCADYDGSGWAGSGDMGLFMTAYSAGDHNVYPCYPYLPDGACCLPAGICVMTTQAECVPPGVWHGEWYACLPNPCPQPQGACCTPAGACSITLQVDCLLPDLWHGEWLACDPNPCPLPPLGTCCASTGDCTMTIQLDCPPPSVWHGGWLSCDPNPCLSAGTGAESEQVRGSVPAFLHMRNPMAPGVSQEISFYVPQAGPISLKAYDITGAVVRTIASGSLDAGVHRVTWSGSNGSGVPDRPGAYILRLTTAQGSAARKVIRLR